MITYKAKNAAGEIINSALSPFAFPAGEAHIKREDRRELEPIEIAILQPDADSIHDDLFHLAMWHDYIKRQNRAANHAEREDETRTVVLLPYIPGARADRGMPFGLDVYMTFIHGSVRADQYIVFDPHSHESESMLGANYHRALTTVLRPHDILAKSSSYAGIIAPDKGAVGRAQAVADKMGLPLFTAEKARDFETGKLKGYELDMPKDLDSSDHFLVVDDICDGGGTFMLLADAFQKLRPQGHLDLYVSHGVFSGTALDKLGSAYDMVATTNSYSPLRPLPSRFHRIDIIRHMLKAINV